MTGGHQKNFESINKTGPGTNFLHRQNERFFDSVLAAPGPHAVEL